MNETAMLEAGSTLHGRYTIDGLLAHGGMSTLYLARDANLGGTWVVKEMRPLQARPEDLAVIRDQFRREAQILSQLRHRGIPRVIDYFTEGETDYLVEEYIPGESFDEILERQHRLTEYETSQVARLLLDILEYLHGSGIIYRDLKPGNVMRATDGRIMLVDFGIARLYTAGKSNDTVIVGTPGFASPEHYGRGQTDERSDVYSLGATMHQMLTGRDPADSPFSFEAPARALPGLSNFMSDLVMRALALRPEHRFPNAVAMRSQLIAGEIREPLQREYRYPWWSPLPRPVVHGGLWGTILGSILGTGLMDDPTLLLLTPAWVAAISVASVGRGFLQQRARVCIEKDGLAFWDGPDCERVPWEEITEVRVRRTSGIDRTLWGTVQVYPSRVDVITATRTHGFLPVMAGWESLLFWVVYRAGLRAVNQVEKEGADEVFAR